ncbi:NACHT domain-containing protein [Micromonospora sp. LOL_023]|uniref:NACHT domain-containing protein n=1 Tax=Micromonospora sp. LOL_023 TaxID=3345418 RepID=UPI003A835303
MELQALAVAASIAAANASIRNTELLRTIGSLRDIHTFEQNLREQVKSTHGSMKLPHAGTTRRVSYRKLFVEPLLNRAKQEDDDEEPRELEDVLLSQPRTVILGNPGGGKSTLALKFTYDIARRTASRNLPTTPLLVVLREYSESLKSEKRTIVSYLEDLCRSPYNIEPPSGAIEYLLLNGRAYVIFDGLDELVDLSVRKQLVTSVENFANLYPTASILVTTREVGYDQAPLDERIFQSYNLAPLNFQQVTEYAKKWFALDESIERTRRIELAKAFIADSEYVADLRTNPLMLSLMCGIYSSEHYIPTNRPEVYRKCAELLFERWDKQRGIVSPLPFDAHVRRALDALALWMLSGPNFEKGVSRETLTEFMTKYLHKKRFAEEAEAENAAVQFIEFCTGRAWVLTDIGSNIHQELYGFTHRTFLEFFAANQLVRLNTSAERLLGVLQERIANQEWDMVAQLALQILGQFVEDGSDDFLDSLMDCLQSTHNQTKKISMLSFATRALAFIVPRPAVASRIASTVVDLQEMVDLQKKEGTKGQRRPWRLYVSPWAGLRASSSENRDAISRGIEESLKERLSRNPGDEVSLMTAAFLGHLDDPHSSAIDNFWDRQSKEVFGRFQSEFRAAEFMHLWIPALLATTGASPAVEVVSRFGFKVLVVHEIAGRNHRAPVLFRWWTGHTDGWRDSHIDNLMEEIINPLIALPRPWLLADDPGAAQLISAMSSGPKRRPRDSGNPTVYTASCIFTMLPIAEAILAEGKFDGSAAPVSSRTGRRPTLSLLIDARTGADRPRSDLLGRLHQDGQSDSAISFLEEWTHGRISTFLPESPDSSRRRDCRSEIA